MRFTVNPSHRPGGPGLRGLSILLPALALLSAPGRAQEGPWVDVFNGTDLTGLKKHGSGTTKVVDGMIEVSGGNGYLHTEKDYSHYRVKVEWKNVGGGNSGFLFHVDLNRHACGPWPSGLECQMMRGDVGSLYTTDCKASSRGSGGTYSETGPLINSFGQSGCGRTHFVRSSNREKVGDWNQWEMFVKNDSMEIKVNGTVVMRTWKLIVGSNTPLTKGKMGLQIEGSTVQWRNWQVMDLTLPSVTLQPRNPQSLRRRAPEGYHPMLTVLAPDGDPVDLAGRRIPAPYPLLRSENLRR
jgi:hypothetical protein